MTMRDQFVYIPTKDSGRWINPSTIKMMRYYIHGGAGECVEIWFIDGSSCLSSTTLTAQEFAGLLEDRCANNLVIDDPHEPQETINPNVSKPMTIKEYNAAIDELNEFVGHPI